MWLTESSLRVLTRSSNSLSSAAVFVLLVDTIFTSFTPGASIASKTTVYIVLVRASEYNRLSGVVTSFFRQFRWFGTGHGACHLCQNTCLVFLEKLRPRIIKVDDN